MAKCTPVSATLWEMWQFQGITSLLATTDVQRWPVYSMAWVMCDCAQNKNRLYEEVEVGTFG